MQLILDTKNTSLSKKRGCFFVQDQTREKLISPIKITSIAITKNVMISSDAIILAIQNEIPILFFNHLGKAKGRLWSPYFESISTLRRNQVYFARRRKATEYVINLFHLKTEQAIKNLRYLQNRKPALKTEIEEAIAFMEKQDKELDIWADFELKNCKSNIMGTEGNIAKHYWQTLSKCLPEKYRFKKRSRRPAEDMFNATLNYFYGMTYSVVEGAVFAAGLDPHLGILHADEYNKSTLSFDLIEPFRPWIDRLLIDQCMGESLHENFYKNEDNAVYLASEGKGFIIPLFNDFMQQKRNFDGKRLTNKNHIYRFAGKLSTIIKRL